MTNHQTQTILDYYTQQSRFTTPGDYADLFETLPDDIAGLCKVVQGLVFHYMADGYDIPPERLPEVDTRYVEKILARLIELDHRPLIEPRPIEKRIIGCCRDFAVLFCAMARYKGIPCRVRVGFAAYINIGASGFNVDHEIAEYWDSEAMRWRLIDPEQTAALIEFNQITFDVTDIPRDQFIVGGQAWQACQQGKADPLSYGVNPSDEFLRGWWFIRNRMMIDFVALNRAEILLWDSWTIADYPEPATEDMMTMDEVSRLAQGDNELFHSFTGLYESNPRLQVPQTVTVYSPIAPPREEQIEF